MFGSIIRNYKNAGANVEVTLLAEETPGQKPMPTFAVFKGTALAVHDLASKGQRELLRQARSSALPRRPGEHFEDIAWSVAAASIRSALPEVQRVGAERAGFVLPYLCFLAEHLSLEWADRESRDVFLELNRNVWVHGVAGMHSYDVMLSPGQKPVRSPA